MGDGDLKERILAILPRLTPREQEVISARFGLKAGAPMTLEMIGRQYGVDVHRLRQIEAKALRWVRGAPDGEQA